MEKLVEQAITAMNYAYTPYSNFKVGAALLTEDNQVYTGCNVENGAYTPSCCAERTAFVKAISEGKKEFHAIAIVGGKDGTIIDFCYPCGVCRQVMSEFCASDFKIILYNGKEMKKLTLNDILPYSFHLEDHE